jgi:hypothetical protein
MASTVDQPWDKLDPVTAQTEELQPRQHRKRLERSHTLELVVVEYEIFESGKVVCCQSEGQMAQLIPGQVERL